MRPPGAPSPTPGTFQLNRLDGPLTVRAAVGSIELPLAFRLLSVRGDRLYGVWQDELGVETVRVYRIQKQ